jgi:sortase A
MKALTILERSLLALGLILLAVFAGVLIYRQASSRVALNEFDEAPAVAANETAQPPKQLLFEELVNFDLWSEKRVRAYRESLSTMKNSPIAVVRIEKANIRVPVYEGTDELALNRGLGWIEGTARPGEGGNIGIAGHRDGFFRKLKDLSSGDEIELSTIGNTAVYTVDEIKIVTPNDVSVLRPRAAPSLTLVTCYPFYFIGDAPQRYILHGSLKERIARSLTRR